ncbi:Lipid-binding START domain containing protein [Paragonimus heterotremus]|uniref:Lipid-binding START domain containing protein n=1 Tax=Paragonimus heterotremus TaxID=100268 RepID=A0A8J4T3Y9_9TREM|nr:Lipid-binding START domain containing protein [Paragonimus heterotremus]
MSMEVLRGACIPDDEYMQQVRNLCDDHTSWNCDYAKSNISVFSKSSNSSNIKIIKLFHVFKDVHADLLFDTLMDSEYRKVWDKNMVESFELCHINPNNDIGYYALRSFPAICDRDFVLQRSWLQTGSEFIITNRSVFHKVSVSNH